MSSQTKTIVWDSLPTSLASSSHPVLETQAEVQVRSDSGYATNSHSSDIVSTPKGKLFNITRRIRFVSRASGIAQHLSCFEKEVDAATLSRFEQIQMQIEKPLIDYVFKKNNVYKPMAIRLMVLGSSEVDAQPYMVILAPDDECKRVRKFFNKTAVKGLCNPEGKSVCFEVLVLGRPPELKLSEEEVTVYTSLPQYRAAMTSGAFDLDTLCGLPIYVHRPDGTKGKATLGGVIKATFTDGTFRLYGMTAGHTIGEALSVPTTVSPSFSSSEDLLLSDSDNDNDESLKSEEHGYATEIEIVQEANENIKAPEDNTHGPWNSFHVKELGIVLKDMTRQGNLSSMNPTPSFVHADWALIDLLHYQPNRLRHFRTEVGQSPLFASRFGDLSMPREVPTVAGKTYPIVMMSGSQGPKQGCLSKLPSRLCLGLSATMTPTYIVNLYDAHRILDGDSGSWVVHEHTLEVYGHIVASDAFGGGYVVPLNETFQEMRINLGALAVELASLMDMASATMEKSSRGRNVLLDGGRPNRGTIQTPPPECDDIDTTIDDANMDGSVSLISKLEPSITQFHPVPTPSPSIGSRNSPFPDSGTRPYPAASIKEEEELSTIISGLESPRGKRASRPGARTGCMNCQRRKIKCDEQRPSCDQCLRSQLICRGLEPGPRDQAESSRDMMAEAAVKPGTVRQEILPSGLKLFHTPMKSPFSPQEGMYFQFYREKVADQISYPFESTFWAGTVLQVSHVVESVRFSVLAIGALYRSFDLITEPSNLPSEDQSSISKAQEHHEVSFRHYSNALQAVISHGSNKTTLDASLLTSIILSCFDCLIGDWKQATRQIQNGIQILERQRINEGGQFPPGSEKPAENDMAHMATRLAIQGKYYDMAFNFPEQFKTRLIFNEDYASPSARGGSPSSIIESSPMPGTLSSVGEARLHWDALFETILRFTETLFQSTSSTNPTGILPPSLRQYGLDFKHKIEAWSNAYEALLEARTTPGKSRQEAAAISILKMAQLTGLILFLMTFSDSELQFDSFNPHFRAIVTFATEVVQSEELLATFETCPDPQDCQHQSRLASASPYPESQAKHMRPSFRAEMGIVFPLFIVATKCRHYTTRRQAIQLLLSSARREGMWDSEMAARIGIWVCSIEEENSGGLPSPGPSLSGQISTDQLDPLRTPSATELVIPDQKRVTLQSVDFDLRERIAMVKCGSRNLVPGMPDPKTRVAQLSCAWQVDIPSFGVEETNRDTVTTMVARIRSMYITLVQNEILFLAWKYHEGDSALISLAMLWSCIICAASIMNFPNYGVMLVADYYHAIYSQSVLNDSPLESGIHMLPTTLGMLLSMVTAGGLTQSTGYYLPMAIIGPCISAVGYGLLSTLSPTTRTARWIGYQILYGVGSAFGNDSETWPGPALQALLESYATSVDRVMYLGVGLAAGALAFCWGLGWHNILEIKKKEALRDKRKVEVVDEGKVIV